MTKRKISPKYYEGTQKTVRSAALVVICAVTVLSIVIPVLSSYLDAQRYKLSDATTKLIGPANSNLASKVTFDAQTDSYYFNKDAIQDQTPASATGQGPDVAGALRQMKAQAGGSGKKDDSTYSLQLPTDPSKGLTYYDNNTNLSFVMVPDFAGMAGKQVNDRLLYPVAGGEQAVYTVKNNGLKEDLVLTKPVGDKLSFDYTLKLPSDLEARLLPSGDLGIYSADPSLFGNISYGSADDEAKVMDARKNAKKDHLVFGIPRPVIKQSGNKAVPNGTKADFSLDGNILTVKAGGLATLNYPVSIDPSVVITSSADFATGNNEGGIDFPTDQINRGALTGGSVGTWAKATNIYATARYGQGTVAYNGYIYVVGGYGTTYLNDVQYAPINSDGTPGAWHYTHDSIDDGSTFVAGFYNPCTYKATLAYNGYLYIAGGYDGSVDTNDVQFAPLNADGTVGAWQYTYNSAASSSFVGGFMTGRYGHTMVAYDNFLYILGGWDGTNLHNDVQYAPLNADGTVGAWHYTHNSTDDGTTFVTGFTTARYNHTSVAYNGYIYVIGGFGSTDLSDVQYAPLNADGTVGSWAATTSFPNARNSHTSVIYGGYLYNMGGEQGNLPLLNDVVQYAPLNANGTVGTWQTTFQFQNPGVYRENHSSVAYNGRLYVLGGYDGNGPLADISYVSINGAGVLGSWATTTAFPTIKQGKNNYGLSQLSSVAYAGYLYTFGGETTGPQSTVQSAPISSTGTVGAWTSQASLPAALANGMSTSYNGYIYIIGGGSSGTSIYYTQLTTTGNITSWATATTTLPYNVGGAGVTAYKGYLYISGGWHATSDTLCVNTAATNECNNTMYAPIASNGSLGTFTVSANYFNTPRDSLELVAWGDNLYVIGGESGSASPYTTYSDIQYASINSDGSIGAWQTSANALLNGGGWMQAFVYNGYAYAVGESNGSVYSNKVEYARILASGDIGSWQNTQPFSTAREQFGLAVYNNFVYVMGGWPAGPDAGGTFNDVQFAPINNGGPGALNAWASTTAMPSTLDSHGLVASNGYLYAVGGYDGSGDVNTVQYAPINTDGSVGTWAPTSSFTNSRDNQATFAYNGKIYIAGGADTNTGSVVAYDDVQCAAISPTGTLGGWGSCGSSIPIASYGMSWAVWNGKAYILGGDTGAGEDNGAWYASFDSSGNLGSWTSTTVLPWSAAYHAAVAYDGYMYIIGGDGGTGSDPYSDVYRSAINSSTGDLEAWVKQASLITGRENLTAVAYDGHIYVLGGITFLGIYMNSVEYATIPPNGSIGGWQTTAPFATGRNEQGTTVYKGTVYLSGGEGSGGIVSDVQYASINSISRAGVYSKLFDLGTTAALGSITYNGTLPGGLNAISYKTAGSDGVFGSLQSAASLGGGSSGTCSSGGTTRYVWVSVTLDDSQAGAVYADASGPSNANLTDLTLNYATSSHPPPNLRLYQGKSFISQVLQPLDTCGA